MKNHRESIFKAALLVGFVLGEERDDVLDKMLLAADPISHSIPVIGAYNTTAEIGFKGMQNLDIPLVLNDREFRKYLVPDLHIGMPVDPDMEAALTIYETHYPLRFEVH